MDPEARAKAPILEVGKPGEPGHVRLVESEVISRYLEDAFPDPPMQPCDPACRAKGNLFVATFMELVTTNYMMILAAKTQDKVDQAWVGVRRGLFAVDIGLSRYSIGDPFFGESFGLVEALCAPFVIRMLLNVKKHRGVDIMAFEDLPRATLWMAAIRNHPSVLDTSPSEKSLCTIPAYLEPFFQATVSPKVHQAKPSSPAASEATFAASIDAGLAYKRRSSLEQAALPSKL